MTVPLWSLNELENDSCGVAKPHFAEIVELFGVDISTWTQSPALSPATGGEQKGSQAPQAPDASEGNPGASLAPDASFLPPVQVAALDGFVPLPLQGAGPQTPVEDDRNPDSAENNEQTTADPDAPIDIAGVASVSFPGPGETAFFAGSAAANDKIATIIHKGDKNNALLKMKKVVENRDTTYSPLALYFLIDNNLLENQKEINDLFDILINKTSLEKEIKNLIIYKKALYNADSSNEQQLLDILNPLLNSKSVWKSHALHLIAEFFYSKGEKQKSKEFFNEILNTENANQDIIKEAQKRLNRDLSD